MNCYGLIGKTLSHSFSKTYFEKKFAAEGRQDCSYNNFELKTIEEFPSLIQSNPELKGVNVTIPYKEAILPYLDYRNDVVEAIGACNCIKIDRERKLHGYNTDVVGFRESLEKQLLPQHNKALVLGTGGASKAVQYVLQQLDISFKIVSRSRGENIIGYEDLTEEVIKSHKLIINTTPLGMSPNLENMPSLPYQYLTEGHFLFDLIYNPEKTRFLQEGEKRGARISNGYEMLVLQAEESWRIWQSGTLEK